MTPTRRARVASVLVAITNGLLRARSTILDAVGAALIVAGIALWSVPLAVIAAGVAVLLIAHPIPVRRVRR